MNGAFNQPGEPKPPAGLTTYTRLLTKEQAARLKRYLAENNFVPREVAYAQFAAATDRVNVAVYQSGKLVVQGKGCQEFVEFTLEPLILRQARLGYEEILDPDLLKPRIGVDESGKGDFFGPLCVAGVYVNAEVCQALKKAGVRDSKEIGSDRRIRELAELIRSTRGCVHTVVPIGNEAYNRLFFKLRSANAILAWGHARVIENLMLLRYQMNPLPVRAISDQFAADKATVAKALMSLGREIELIQRHKAESDLAVAAASILARNEFITRLQRMGEQYAMTFPKGVSNAVEEAGKAFLARHGVENLPKVAKMHFRTTYKIQGLPEPPKYDWKAKK